MSTETTEGHIVERDAEGVTGLGQVLVNHTVMLFLRLHGIPPKALEAEDRIAAAEAALTSVGHAITEATRGSLETTEALERVAQAQRQELAELIGAGPNPNGPLPEPLPGALKIRLTTDPPTRGPNRLDEFNELLSAVRGGLVSLTVTDGDTGLPGLTGRMARLVLGDWPALGTRRLRDRLKGIP